MTDRVIKKLSNGFVIALIKNQGVKSVSLQLRGFAGSNYEQPDEVGVAHLTEHLALQNAKKDELLLKGAKVLGVTSREDVLFMIKAMKQDVGDAIDFLYEAFKVSSFNPGMLEASKGVAIEEEKRFLGSPEKLISRFAKKLLYPGQRIAEFNIGKIEDIQKITVDTTSKFKDRVYSPKNFCLTISGDLTISKILNYVQPKFGKALTAKSKQSRVAPVELSKNKEFKTQCIQSQFYSQTHVIVDYYGFILADPNRIPGLVLAKILDNHLRNEIKSKRGYAYSVGCDSFSSYSYGIFSFYFAADKKNFPEVLKLIFNLKENYPKILSADKILMAKNQLLSDLEFAYEKTSFRADYYSTLVLQRLYKQSFASELKAIKKIRSKDLLRIGKMILGQNPKVTILSDEELQKTAQKLYLESGK